MMKWSVLAALLGVVGTGIGTVQLLGRNSPHRPEAYWLLGMSALLPAWLIAFLGVVGRSTGARPEKALTVSWILSSSAALLGVIITDAALRRLGESGRGRHPVTLWILGVVTLLPALGVALIALSMTATAR